MNDPTLATTAQQSVTTLKTNAIDTATAAVSMTPQRIDDFIKHKLGVANSDDGSGIIDSATRAARLGFASAANVRYSAFLNAFRSLPHLTEKYQEKYPNSLFLPWKAMHAVMRALDLRMDLPEFYLGAVPSEQLPWLEIFDLHPEDTPAVWDIHEMIPQVSREARNRLERVLSDYLGRDDMLSQKFIPTTPEERYEAQKEIILRGRMAGPAAQFWQEACDSFFVVAPPDAFSTRMDWLTRLSELTRQIDTLAKIPPDDPLVVRLCYGGCLVVAAWGAEAASLNAIVSDLKL